ncbi:hypothetical protein WMY93_004292 [Mugilogobius chulae]|uniref:THD domain-containing protein n=1 Tax=Mugilogobius chulae TaxID=88201 RepID=A0AAW0PXV7_9GOBI
MRLLRTTRVISVSMVLLVGMVLAILVLLLFGSPAALLHGKESENTPAFPEAQRQKLQSDPDVPHPSALLTVVPTYYSELKSEHGNTHLKGGMIVSNGNLSLPIKGLYRIYLQVTFDFDSENYDICEDDMVMVNISVKRCSNSYKQFRVLLASMDTLRCSQDWSKSLITTGTFELEANTVLQVHINHNELVRKQDIYSFFGVELVSAVK